MQLVLFFDETMHDLDESFGLLLRKRLSGPESLFNYLNQLMLDEWARAHIFYSQKQQIGILSTAESWIPKEYWNCFELVR